MIMMKCIKNKKYFKKMIINYNIEKPKINLVSNNLIEVI